MDQQPSFFAELKRRNVYKVAIAYAVISWLLIQIGAVLLPTFEAPAWVMKVFVLLLAAGFPIALIIAWAFEMTPTGIKRTENILPNETIPQWSARKFTLFIMGVALFAICLLTYQLVRSGKVMGFIAAKPATSRASLAEIPEKSIAVLPFDNLSEEKGNAYFAEGIQDEILTRLSKIAALKVISRTSTEQYKSKPGNLAEIAKQLGVAHILEGSVQKAKDAIRVNVQLIKAGDDSHLWAETYDRKLTDIFAVESEVAQRIASSLEARLSGREQKQLADIPTTNGKAYEAYLQGLALLNQQGYGAIESAIGYLRSATELDPQYAQAWAQLGSAESQKSFYERTPAQLGRARQAVETAMRLQPELAEVHAGLATYYYYGLRDFDRALREMEEARSRDPNNAEVIFYIGLIKRRQGKLEESLADQHQAAVLDPRNPDIWVNLSGSYRGKRDFKTARTMIDHALEISPDDLEIIGIKAETYSAEGNLDAADEVLRGHQLVPHTEASYQKRYVLLCRRKPEEAIQSYLVADAVIARMPPLPAATYKSHLGQLHWFAGHRAAARQLLEDARQRLITLRAGGNTSTDVLDALVEVNGFLGDRVALDKEAAALLKETATDKWRYGLSEQIVAAAYAALGAADRALPLIEHVLSIDCDYSLTLPNLRQYPGWDPIRNDPRFQKLLAGQELAGSAK